MAYRAQVTCAGKIAYDLLSAPSAGVVYAVFQRTFYLKKTDNLNSTSTDKTRPATAANAPLLCCIGLAELEHGPLNISTSLNALPVTLGNHWYSDQQLVTIGTIELDLTRTKIWQPPATDQSTIANEECIALLHQLLTDSAPLTQSQNRIDRLINDQLFNASKQLQRWLNSCQEKNPDTLFPDNILGCGDGLTPAGDDIIVGVLIAMHSWNRAVFKKLVLEVTERIDTTSNISAAHLLAACSGSGIEPLHNLIETISAQSHHLTSNSDYREELTQAANALANYGHSSGYYAMRGVSIAAESRLFKPA